MFLSSVWTGSCKRRYCFAYINAHPCPSPTPKNLHLFCDWILHFLQILVALWENLILVHLTICFPRQVSQNFHVTLTIQYTHCTFQVLGLLFATRCFCEAYTGLPVVRATENQKGLNCVVLKYSIPVSEEQQIKEKRETLASGLTC